MSRCVAGRFDVSKYDTIRRIRYLAWRKKAHSVISGLDNAGTVDTVSMSRPFSSLSLVTILLLSLMVGMVTVPTVSANNETKAGIVVGTETWSGTHTLTGNVTVAEGAKLVINAGTTVNVPAGKYLQIRGAICAGDANCGATQGSTSSPVRFLWGTPADATAYGWCYSPGGQAPLYNQDAACGGGMIVRDTIDEALTSLNFVHFEKAYGIPVYSANAQKWLFGALVFDGASMDANGLSFTDINTSNIIALNAASPTITNSAFTLGVDEQSYKAASIQAYGAGLGILSTMQVSDSTFTGDTEAQCGNQGGGFSMIYTEDSYIRLDRLDISDNAYGVFMRGTSGWLTNSSVETLCNAIDTNSFKQTGDIEHTLYIDDNTILTEEGAGITAYDGARVSATGNSISGASSGSGFGIRSSVVEAYNNDIGPIEGYNGLWIYGSSDVIAENNTIHDTAREPVVLGEYHYKDQGWSVPAPSANRMYLANNIIENNSGTCNSNYMYGGDFPCPAIHVFMASATIEDNTVSNNQGDAIRVNGGIVNVQGNTMETGDFAVRISQFDDNYGNKYGSIGYFSDNTWTNATQVYNVTESRITVQSEFIPDVSSGYPVMLAWEGAECPYVTNECLQLPVSSEMPPRDMPLAIELVTNSTVFSYADLQNFDTSKIFVQNQNSEWGTQVRKGELVRYQVKAAGSNVADATVVIRDSVGLPLYELDTDPFGFTDFVSLPSDFLIDRNWNHVVGDTAVDVPGTPTVESIDENSCADGYDNDGDTKVDTDDEDCTNGREQAFYTVEAYKFGKGEKTFSFTLSGGVDDIINLDNLRPSVVVDQLDGSSFATTVTLTGSAWDGIAGSGSPGEYALDQIAYEKQFGIVKRVEVQPPGSQSWYSATDTSGANGVITKDNHPFKSWTFEWDLSGHPEGESDVTFRVRSFDGLDNSVQETRKYKLNLVAPTLILNEPLDGSTHRNGKVLFTGTASDPYVGVQGSDIQQIWFNITGPNDYFSHLYTQGQTAWEYQWNFEDLPSGEYTFEVWAADSDFCIDWPDGCNVERRTLIIENDNTPPFVTVDAYDAGGSLVIDGGILRADENTYLQGGALDNDGQVTRVEVQILDLASGILMSDEEIIVTQFLDNGGWQAIWDTSDYIHDQQYEITARAYDGEDYSEEVTRRVRIDNPVDKENNAPVFNGLDWPQTLTIFCDKYSNSIDRCGAGESIDLAAFFSDADVDSTLLIYDVFDDPATFEDDDYPAYITINARGVATYNPMDGMSQTTTEISEWSLEQVMFEAQDEYGSVAYSFRVNFLVRAVEFDVQKDSNEAFLDTGVPASFSGTGLPGSTVTVRSDAGGLRLNSTRVLSDGTWSMDVTINQLNSDSVTSVYFEMDGQQGNDMYELTPKAAAEGGVSMIWIIVGALLAVVVLAGVVLTFFVEYEDFEEEAMAAEAQVEEDPYAWAKKSAPAIPAQQNAAATPAAAGDGQHPGWLWDAESNQWVPDPNYVPPTE